MTSFQDIRNGIKRNDIQCLEVRASLFMMEPGTSKLIAGTIQEREEVMAEFECIELEDIEDVSVVKFRDEKVMDPSRIEQMGIELLALVSDDDDSSNVLINFENVNFFSSAAINKLIVLEKRLRASGGQIRLSNLRPEVRDLFSYTNLDSMFQIKDEQAEALDSFEE